MTNAILTVIEGRKKAAEVIEVATSQLTEHSKQAEYSPQMSKKKWREFLAGIAKEGILQPIVVTKGFRVIDGKHRLKAAKELNIEYVRVIIEDIPEDKIPAYITETKLNRDDLKPGQKAAIVIRLHHEEKGSQGKRTDLSPNGEKLDAHDKLAKMAGVGKGSIGRLLPVYRNRPDLFERVFNGEMTINKAYTTMKADEEPDKTKDELLTKELTEEIAEQIKSEETKPQYDETQHELSPHNRVVRLRKNALSIAAEILDKVETINEVEEDVKDSVREQLLSLARICLIALGETSESDDGTALIYLGLEVLDKFKENGGN